MKRFILLFMVICSYIYAGALLVNGSFEQPEIGNEPPNHIKSWAGGKIVTYKDDDVNGWNTTASDEEMEFWSAAAGTPYEGNQFIELNANEVAAVYQDIPTTPGKKFHWFVAHRGRSGVDTARVLIGAPNGELTEIIQMVDDKDTWGTYQGSYLVPDGQTITRFQFEAVSTATGSKTIGNFLDGFKVGPMVEYKMDECYWLNGDNSVKDSSENGADAEAMNGARIDKNNKVSYHSGYFDGEDDYLVTNSNDAFDFNTTMTISMWIRPQVVEDQTLIQRYETSGSIWNSNISGWILQYQKGSFFSSDKLSFTIQIDGSSNTVSLKPDNWNDNNWHFVIVRYDGNELTLMYDEQIERQDVSGSVDNANTDLLIGASQNGNSVDNNFKGYIDEVKIFGVALGDDELEMLKYNDQHQNNYTGQHRNAPVCDSSIQANTWEHIGIPADFRKSSNPKPTVSDIFSDDMSGDYGSDWIIYKRDYSDTNNSSWYTVLAESDNLDFGRGYWLGSKLDSNWSENGASSVDYNSTYNGTSDCASTRCVEFNLRSVSKDFAEDENDGTGPYRYNMNGFIGKTPIDWADCRFIVMNLDGSNKEVLTPSGMDDKDYANKQIWIYNPSASDANNNGYTTCDDTAPGGCMLEPYKGFWIELHGKTKNKIVKLLLPQGE